jgi:hypothetical protein
VVHTANFHAGTHGGKDIPESITWSILLMLCVLHARYDSAIPSTVGQLSTNIRTSANLARAAEKHTASRRLRTREGCRMKKYAARIDWEDLQSF